MRIVKEFYDKVREEREKILNTAVQYKSEISNHKNSSKINSALEYLEEIQDDFTHDPGLYDSPNNIYCGLFDSIYDDYRD